MRVFHGIDGADGLESAVGEHLGYGDWLTVTQKRIDLFAAATGDDQWIHTDVERAAAGPFGATVTHGFLTLSMFPLLSEGIYTVTGLQMAVNYGSDRVRYLAPLLVGSSIRAGVELLSVVCTSAGAKATTQVVIERQQDGAPVCVAELIALLVP